ncbi:SusD/RagB family nutrient-binding outer membrane lipoprotein [Elizabethkingia meningoseptica]|uniref:SusD/RagB family nutrient-binding outer membrane lipoprotein n=1 Tax=Elizabethkingia meningoseptica TaxID=238 RepID=UPI002011EA3C|nr:SusD/RagB family nutrient-binding outer membrane lipoprotein [Elizabethkingia meningoseptica]MCL1675773.1 SusD/RagB family nutrient-binding outer membrane lipoprotein [Elizabethkingia meningoseptica]MCL1686812.1 SusD/RagB family nutrient-binding outer membrane lipoprotein [Elizabethkingia meningoseptica]MDE5430428.1 SusD/RagB family nutrient-binding outer membrane lipoprotein [Elizabethkingia meningoseptica]MDE5469464.1 SusD/RagB family nutrient-binding outer membrane lipoprotein [Elizabethk
MKKIFFIIAGCIVFNSCTREFAETNTNPADQLSANPEDLFPTAIQANFNNSFEYYYDYYRGIMPWSQMTVSSNGNSPEFMANAANMNARYSNFYGTYGGLLTDMIHIIDGKSAQDQARYVYIKSVARIMKAYYAWYVSDVNGSMPYLEAFQARYGGTKTPKYETQDQLYKIFDDELKDAANQIQNVNASSQVAFGNKDLVYGGKMDKWVKAANTIRIKIALRLSKRDPQRMASIINDAISKSLMTSTEDDFSIRGRRFTEHGNFNPSGFYASAPLVNFMVNKSDSLKNDPRLPIFFYRNDYSANNIQTLINAKLLPASDINKAKNNRYVGGTANPDAASKAREYNAARRRFDNKIYDTISRIQERLWMPDFNGGTGNSIMPLVTYADLCLMKAELAYKGIIGGDPATFYKQGIEASIETYNKIAREAAINNYIPTTPDQITQYLSSPDVAYNSSIGLEQIYAQQYINYFKQPNEAWALIKRTNIPNTNTILRLEGLFASGNPLTMPRRMALPSPSKDNLNYPNQQAALEEMQKEPGFGQQPENIYGKVWWDK